MGFLRKIGRKVNKKLKKVFGAKLGKIVGMVGLYFVMGAAAKQLSGWTQSLFGKGSAASTNVATKASELTAQAAEAAGTAVEAESLGTTSALAKDAAITLESKTAKGVEALTSNLDSTLNEKAMSRMDLTNDFIGKSENLVKSGQTAPSLATSPTDLIIDASANSEQILSQTNADVFKTLNEQPIDFSTDAFVEKGNIFETNRLTPKEGSTFMDAVNNPSEYARLPTDATVGEKINRFASNTFDSTKKFTKEKVTDAREYIKGDFVPDTIKTVGSGAISNYFNPQEEQTGGGGQVMGQPLSEQAQVAHMRDMTSQLNGLGLTNIKSYTDMANQTLYGTGSPNHIQHMYQPLPNPTIRT